MKKQKPMEKPIEKKKSMEKVWKTVAISVIVVFVVFIAIGVTKVHNMRAKELFVKPTQEQVNKAIEIATAKLESSGANVSEFKVETGKMMPKRYDDEIMMPVSFRNNVTTHTYLVDLKSEEIIMHSQTDIYKQLGPESKEPKERMPYRNEMPGRMQGFFRR